MSYQNLLVDNQDGIIILTLNREKALNALNKQTMAELHAFFEEDYKTYGKIKGIVLTGAGEKAFVAGADIKELLGLNAEQASQTSKFGQNIFFNIEQMNVPVIAAINGFTLGGGCELAMSCHMRIATEKSKFGQPEVNLGIVPGYGGTQRLIQLIGKGKAIELILTGDMITAQEAKTLGLVNHVVEIGQEVEKAKEIIEKISTKGPLAVSKSISLINSYFNKKEDGFELEWQAFGEFANTKDFKEGATAFVERRPAKFTGE